MTRPDLPVAACPTAEDHSGVEASPLVGFGESGIAWSEIRKARDQSVHLLRTNLKATNLEGTRPL